MTVLKLALHLRVGTTTVRDLVTADPAKYGAVWVPKGSTAGGMPRPAHWSIPFSAVELIRADLPEPKRKRPQGGPAAWRKNPPVPAEDGILGTESTKQEARPCPAVAPASTRTFRPRRSAPTGKSGTTPARATAKRGSRKRA